MITQDLISPKEKTDGLHMSYKEFLAWAGEDTHPEWVDGFWLRPSWLWQAGETDSFLAFCEIRRLPPEKAEEFSSYSATADR